ncbi:nitroreductase/quinone reductase family protein [Blastococcus sp. LR1]|uniref:nitroreductase/quinone reductase family protein n=1 Tax=Blastococcus sp. LR1 TaxID=2877000 RepID=UPI001CCDA07B|nr:nitroreductase/quinone reductase family protein [Blastococcus sp. LR1]MCA0144336.1 nitroreductase family deazaflavin-dependent oxidoreductase [Blastococcus sp. LR1]
MSDYNATIIAEFRANGGRVDSAGFGTHLVLLHTVGARTGQPRVNPAMSLRDGDAWLVVASAAGAEKDPAWAVNLRAHPHTEIEVATAHGEAQTVPVTATELDGEDYETAFARFVRRSSAFANYQRRAGARRLPVFRLAPWE